MFHVQSAENEVQPIEKETRQKQLVETAGISYDVYATGVKGQPCQIGIQIENTQKRIQIELTKARVSQKNQI